MLHLFRAFSTSNRVPRMPFTYQEAINKLNSLQTNAALLEQLRKAGPRMNQYSLPEMRHYFQRIGYKTEDFNQLNVIHITGTKGKGSTSALTQSILRHYPSDKPIRTGLFTSPHLVAVRERIRINGEPISEELFAKYSEDVWNRLEDTKHEHILFGEEFLSDSPKQAIRDKRNHPDKPIYFRYLTLLAMHAFVQEKVDVAILEVGVGGEYDSTNIVEQPVVCGITSLGLDHVSVLGDTIDQIAWHKAGIIKEGRPVVCFEQVPEAMEVVKQRAAEKHAPLKIISANEVDHLKEVKVGLAGQHQKQNALVAIELCRTWLKEIRGEPLDEAVPGGFLDGLQKVVWPGRGQELAIDETKYASKTNNVKWYLDGAHTKESLEVCRDWFKEAVSQNASVAKRVLVFNCTNGRDGPRLLQIMSSLQDGLQFDHVVFTTNVTFRQGYTSDNTNNTVSMQDAVSMQQSLAESWQAQVPGFAKDHVHVVGSIEEAIDWVVDYGQQQDQAVQVLTTGSLIMVGNTLTVLGIEPR
ncbi:FolC bifunctional protein [Hesseltinella vesiculosa]|uniref:Folylpolyglutamate synthase n=1 Tax=Hesseltinella vesiculosa TaxID=101127 RepID=A0A1X2GE51_9FUNG|nr:FolC bifunctional protein [Hesseltinella vesiculosa]